MTIGLILITGSFYKACAQSVITLTLGQAVKMSLKNSGQLKIEKARVDEAVGASQEASNNQLPDIKPQALICALPAPMWIAMKS